MSTKQVTLDEFKQQHGAWTSMSIHLGDNLYTLAPAPDGRLRRIVQVIQDLAGKPLNQLRVLDLGCGEAHYAIELALHGAEAVGIEYREESLCKARFVKDYFSLDRLHLFQDDVRQLSREKYGEFDVVICSGILYHLDIPDVFHLIRRMGEVCTRLAFIDTQVALRPVEAVEFENQAYHGTWVSEHDDSIDNQTKLKNLWASIDNNRSFWLTPASLANIAATSGFTSFFECMNPHHQIPVDRRAFAAIKGRTGEIMSSPQTAAMGFTPRPEVLPRSLTEPINPVIRLAVRALPGPITSTLRRAYRSVKPKGFRESLKPVVEEARAAQVTVKH